jgi:hypothetical protein
MYKQKLLFRGKQSEALRDRVIGRVVCDNENEQDRKNCFLVLSGEHRFSNQQLTEYAGILVESGTKESGWKQLAVPNISGLEDVSVFEENSIIAMNPNGSINVLYRPSSKNNSLFATARCNSNCIMCSQPPTLADDNYIVNEHLQLVDLIQDAPESLGLTGGEPPLLGNGLV